MGGLKSYSYKYVMPHWSCEAVVEECEFDLPVFQYSTSAMRNILMNSDDVDMKVIASRCTDLTKDDVARLIKDSELVVRISLLENFQVFEHNFVTECVHIEYDDLLQIVKSGRVEEARCIAQNINFTFYTDVIQQGLLDYDDPVIDRAMIGPDLTLESVIELSQRTDKGISLEAFGLLEFLFDACVKWICDVLHDSIQKQLGLGGQVTAISMDGEKLCLSFTEDDSTHAHLIDAKYTDRKWWLALQHH